MLETNTINQNPIGKSSGLKLRIAHLTSNILNPLLLCLTLIVLLSIQSTASVSEAIRWASIATGLGILPIFLIIMYLLRNGKLDDFFIAAREQRTRIYILGTISAGIGCLILYLLNAPITLKAVFVTGVSTAVTFALINLWWKISLHMALIAAFATISVLLYGWAAAWTLPLVPLTAWARIQLHCHSLSQTIFGATLATLFIVFIFQPLAML